MSEMRASFDDLVTRASGDVPPPPEPSELRSRLRYLVGLVRDVSPLGSSAECRLLWRDENGTAQMAPVRGNLIVGRTAGCDILLPSPRVSGRHCRIWRDDAGRCWVADLGSTNGTRRNSVLVTTERELIPGDLIEIGGVPLMVDGFPHG